MSDLVGEYHQDCNMLMKENDQLKARVAELEKAIRSWLPLAVPYQVIEEFMSRAPAQSLAIMQAEVLEEYAKHAPIDGCAANSCATWMVKEAVKLRKAAEDNQ